MEKKMVYIVQEYAEKAIIDSFQLATFDLEEAEREAKYIWNHLTDKEQKDTRLEIEGYMAEVIGDARESYENIFDGLMACEYPQPDFCEDIY